MRPYATFTQHHLEVFVSSAIIRAERLDDAGLPSKSAWQDVMGYELELSFRTSPDSVSGGVARVGVVTAALSAGLYEEAKEYRSQFEPELSEERRAALARAFTDYAERHLARFPDLARRGPDFSRMEDWKTRIAEQDASMLKAA